MSETTTTTGEPPLQDAITDDNDPPYSRLFIVCSKNTTEDMLSPPFSAYGIIQYCKVIREKPSNESKGVAYIKYEKASSAALAIEGMNGKIVVEGFPPLKVMIAESKGKNTKSGVVKSHDDTPPRSRLFIVCPKESTEDELLKLFEPYGGLEYCKIVKDKNSEEHKGVAYAKYDKSSTAAKAMEEVNKLHTETRIKVLIADPKKSQKQETSPAPAPLPVLNPFANMVNPLGFPFGADLGLAAIPGFGVSRQRLFVVCHKGASQESLSRLFGKFPGMEYLDIKKNKHNGESKGFAYVNYSTPQAALLAKEQLDGFEFPAGFFLKVLFAEPLGFKKGAVSEHPSISAIRDSFAQMMTGAPAMSFPMVNYAHPQAYPHYRPISSPIGRPVPARQQQQQHPAQVRHQQPAQHHVPSHSQPPTQPHHSPAGPPQVHHQPNQRQHSAPHRSQQPLPIQQTTQHQSPPGTTELQQIPTAESEQIDKSSASPRVHRLPNGGEGVHSSEKPGKDRNVYPEGSRLYIMLAKPVPQYVLQDTFSRFGGLEYVHLQSGKSYGYAKFTTAATAECAMNYLNETLLHGIKLKIQVALPPASMDSRKRQRINPA